MKNGWAMKAFKLSWGCHVAIETDLKFDEGVTFVRRVIACKKRS